MAIASGTNLSLIPGPKTLRIGRGTGFDPRVFMPLHLHLQIRFHLQFLPNIHPKTSVSKSGDRV
jgi:hypothetical protein